MTYLGDFALESTFDFKFTTVGTTGAPTTLAGTPVISAYVGNSTTQLTAGITLTVDFDAVTGLHNVRVVATAANGYATASNYQLVITTGTVGGTSVVGYVVGQFSIEARSAIRPTVAARTLDVSATGEAGIDWANIGSPTTANNLSATNIDVDQVVASVSGAVGSVSGAVGSVTGNVGGNVVGSVASVTAGVTVTTNNDKTGYALSAAGVDAVWDEATVGHVTAGTYGVAVSDILVDTAEIGTAGAGLTNINLPNQTMDVVGNITGNLSGSVGSVTARVTANTDQVDGVATSAARLARSTQAIVLGTVGAASTTTSIVTSSLDPAAAVIDQFKGRVVIFDQATTTANLRGQATDITASTALGVLTCTALTTAPVSGDTFTIV